MPNLYALLLTCWIVLAWAPPPAAEGPSPDAAVEKKAESPRQSPRFDERQAERDRMINTIRRHGMTDEAVLQIMARVPRHAFVPASRAAAA